MEISIHNVADITVEQITVLETGTNEFATRRIHITRENGEVFDILLFAHKGRKYPEYQNLNINE